MFSEDDGGPESALRRLEIVERKFTCACRYIIMLSQRIDDKKVRHKRAFRVQKRAWRYTQRLQLTTLEGVRSMFVEYADRYRVLMEKLHNSMTSQGMVTDDIADSSND